MVAVIEKTTRLFGCEQPQTLKDLKKIQNLMTVTAEWQKLKVCVMRLQP